MNKIKYILLIFMFGIIMLLFPSCDKNRLYEKNMIIEDNVWNKDDIKTFEVTVNDIQKPANFYINVRNADGYPFNNLFLFIKTVFPDGKIAVDTLECTLADEKGQWLGSGMGDLYDNQIPFKRNVRFPLKGNYIFELQHGMRSDKVPLIVDIGIRIETTE